MPAGGAVRILPLFAAGCASIVVQTVLLRELMAAAHGTEVTLGFGLACWLLGGTLGSLSVPKLWPRTFGNRGLAACFAAVAALALPCLAFLRWFRQAAGYLPGQGVSLGDMALMAFVPMTAAGLFFGAMYAFGVRYIEERGGGFPAGTAYWAEAAGYLAGGAAFTFFLSFRLTGAGAMSLAALLAVVGAGLSARSRAARALVVSMATLAMAPALALAPLFERATQAWAYPGYRVEKTLSSPYGQTVIAERQGERDVFHNGYPVLHRPASPTLDGEELAAWGMVSTGSLRSVLLIGGAELLPVFGRLGECRTLFLEQDPVLLEAMEESGRGYEDQVFKGKGLKVAAADGRLLIERSEREFDLIILAAPPPASMSQNRYYTEEFFRAARKALKNGGALALALPGSQAADRRKARLSRAVLSAMAAAMPSAAFFPGETNFLVGVNGVAPDEPLLLERLGKLPAAFTMLSSKHLGQRLEERRRRKFCEAVEEGPTRRNRDLWPEALAAGILLWQSLYSPGWARMYEIMERLLPLLSLLMAIGLLWPCLRHGGAAFTAGAASMTMQAVCLWGVQVRSGALFQWLGLGNALFMAGVALGAWAYSACGRVRSVRIVQWEAAFTIWALAFLAGQVMLRMPGWAYLACSAATGAVLGLEFPALVKGRSKERGTPEAMAAGPIYAWDTAGGMLSALLVGVVVIPSWGLVPAAAMAVGLKALSLRWWLKG